MKKSLAQSSKLLVITSVLFSFFIFISCDKEEEQLNPENQNLSEWTKKFSEQMHNNDNNSSFKMMDCDCEFILQADVNGSGTISTLDLVMIQRIILFLDFDGDGCIQLFNDQHNGFSDDVMGWFNNGQVVPTGFHDFNLNGTVNSGDIQAAFQIADQLGRITGDNALCTDDLDCIRKQILGVIACE